MVFEEKSKGLIVKRYPNGMDRHIYLDSNRALNLATIQTVYEKEVLKKLSYNMLIKIAIDNLIHSINDLSEDDAIKFLMEHHREVFF